MEPASEEPRSEEPRSEEPRSEEPRSEEPRSEEPRSEEPRSDEQPREKLQLEAESNRVSPDDGSIPIVPRAGSLSRTPGRRGRRWAKSWGVPLASILSALILAVAAGGGILISSSSIQRQIDQQRTASNQQIAALSDQQALDQSQFKAEMIRSDYAAFLAQNRAAESLVNYVWKTYARRQVGGGTENPTSQEIADARRGVDELRSRYYHVGLVGSLTVHDEARAAYAALNKAMNAIDDILVPHDVLEAADVDNLRAVYIEGHDTWNEKTDCVEDDTRSEVQALLANSDQNAPSSCEQ